MIDERQSWDAWLIEHARVSADGVRYASFDEGGVTWTTDPLKACHFVRRSDAEQMAYGEDCWRISEHQFGVPETGDEKITRLEGRWVVEPLPNWGVLPIKPGTLKRRDISELRRARIVVIEHEDPESLRLLPRHGGGDTSLLLDCALRALTNGVTASGQREAFTELLAKAYSKIKKDPTP